MQTAGAKQHRKCWNRWENLQCPRLTNNAKVKGLGSLVSKDSNWSTERRENSEISRWHWGEYMELAWLCGIDTKPQQHLSSLLCRQESRCSKPQCKSAPPDVQRGSPQWYCPLGHCCWSTACRQPVACRRATAVGKAQPWGLPLMHIHTWTCRRISDSSQIPANSPPTQVELPVTAKVDNVTKGSMLLLPPASVSWAPVLVSLSFCSCSRQCWAWPGQRCSLDGNHHQSTECRVLHSPAQADPGRTRSGRIPCCHSRQGTLTEGCLPAPRELGLWFWLLQTTAVGRGTCYKKIKRLDEGWKGQTWTMLQPCSEQCETKEKPLQTGHTSEQPQPRCSSFRRQMTSKSRVFTTQQKRMRGRQHYTHICLSHLPHAQRQ